MTVRTHYIDDDEANEIADRAKARRAGITTRNAAEPAEPARPRSPTSPPSLGKAQAPRAYPGGPAAARRAQPGAYRSWTLRDLKRVLEPPDAAPYKSGGVMVVGRARVLEALAERDRQADEATTSRGRRQGGREFSLTASLSRLPRVTCETGP